MTTTSHGPTPRSSSWPTASTFLVLAPILTIVAMLFIALGTPPGADDITQVSDPQWLYWTLFAALGGSTGAIGFALLARRVLPGDAGVAASHLVLATIPLWLFIFASAGYAAGAMATEGTTVFLTGDRLVLAVDIIEALNNAMFLISGAVLSLVAVAVGWKAAGGGQTLGRGVALTGLVLGAAGTLANLFLLLTKNASEDAFAIGPTATLLLLAWGAWAGITLARKPQG